MRQQTDKAQSTTSRRASYMYDMYLQHSNYCCFAEAECARYYKHGVCGQHQECQQMMQRSDRPGREQNTSVHRLVVLRNGRGASSGGIISEDAHQTTHREITQRVLVDHRPTRRRPTQYFCRKHCQRIETRTTCSYCCTHQLHARCADTE